MKEVLIFDFDGVIADTLPLIVQFGNKNYERFAKKRIELEDFRNQSMREALKHIGLPLHQLSQFVIELKEYLRTKLQEVELFPEIKSLIEHLYKKNNKLFIMSSNSKENIEQVLEKNSIYQCFQGVFSDSSVFGKQKVLSKMFSEFEFQKTNSVYIGDEIRDFEACDKFGIEFLGVSWGYDSFERLKKANIQKIASSVQQLKEYLEF